MSDNEHEPNPTLVAVAALVQEIVETAPGRTDLGYKLDVLERVVELGRLVPGRLENSVRMSDLLGSGVEVDLEGRRLRVGSGRSPSTESRIAWPKSDPRVPPELQTPLLLHLVHNRQRKRRIGKLLADFIQAIRPYLSPLDVESTQTGVPRVATNSRLAARTLRSWGLVRTSREVAFKTWELTHLGLIVGETLVLRGHEIRIDPGGVNVHGAWLAEPIQEVIYDLRDPEVVRQVLYKICLPNSDILNSMTTIFEILQDYGQLVGPHELGALSLRERRSRAEALLESLEEAIPTDQLANDVATDLALRDLLGPYLR